MSDSSRCPNCSTELRGEFCSACGQKKIHPEDLSAHHFFRETIREVASLKVQFKTLRSLIALLNPGFLAAEYLAGRRTRYLSPIKVYLICAAICFAAASLGGYNLKGEMTRDPSGALMKRVALRISERGINQEVFMQRFDLRVQTVFTVGLSVAIIAFALVFQFLFRETMLPYGAHLIFAMYFVSFLFLINPLIAAIMQASGLYPWQVFLLNYLLIGAYLVLGVRRVYSIQSPGSLAWKSGVLISATFVILLLANVGAVLVTLQLI